MKEFLKSDTSNVNIENFNFERDIERDGRPAGHLFFDPEDRVNGNLKVAINNIQLKYM